MLLTSQFHTNDLLVSHFVLCFFLYFYVILLEYIISIASRKYVIHIYRQFSVDVQRKFVLEVSSAADHYIVIFCHSKHILYVSVLVIKFFLCWCLLLTG